MKRSSLGNMEFIFKSSNPLSFAVYGALNARVEMILAQTSPTFLQNCSPDTIDNIYYISCTVSYICSVLYLQCAIFAVCCVGCVSGSQLNRHMFDSLYRRFFLQSNFFVMDKERIMRAPKVQSYGAQPLVRVPKA